MAVWWSNWTFDSNRLSDKTTDFHFADRNWHRVCHTCIKKSEADGNGTWNADDVGFSGSYHRFQTKVTLVSENGNQLTLPVDTDTRYWNAGETEQLLLTLNLSDLSNGTYNVYLKLQDTSLNREIHLATTAEHNEYGYCTGMLSVEIYSSCAMT